MKLAYELELYKQFNDRFKSGSTLITWETIYKAFNQGPGVTVGEIILMTWIVDGGNFLYSKI